MYCSFVAREVFLEVLDFRLALLLMHQDRLGEIRVNRFFQFSVLLTENLIELILTADQVLSKVF